MESTDRFDMIKYAVYFVVNQSTVRQVARHFGVSKTQVHNKLSEMTKTKFAHDENARLAIAVRNLLDKNKQERHVRGGISTKLKYQKEKK